MNQEVLELAKLICILCAGTGDCDYQQDEDGPGVCPSIIEEAQMILDNGYKKVPTGKWVGIAGTGEYFDDYYCSICGTMHLGDKNPANLGSFCPACGAEMKN